MGWREYWDFLGCYCNLHKSEGLQKLEQYLTSFSTPPSSPSLPPHSPPPLSPPPPPPSLPSPPPSSSQAIEAGQKFPFHCLFTLFDSSKVTSVCYCCCVTVLCYCVAHCMTTIDKLQQPACQYCSEIFPATRGHYCFVVTVCKYYREWE